MKRGFGIVEVMVSIVVLGFMYVALSKLQSSNHDAFIRLRGRDGAVEVAQQVMDSLKARGPATIQSAADVETVLELDPITRSWDRGLGGKATISYTPTVTIAPTRDYGATSKSNYENVTHTYAKQVNVKVGWSFKGSNQSINVSGVIQ